MSIVEKDSCVRAVVMLSGGLDSSTVCRLMHNSNREIYALTFNYNQRHSTEIEAAKKVAEFNGVKEHIVFPLDLSIFGGSALTDNSIAVPIDTPLSEIGSTIPLSYVPARNTIFLSVALAYAETKRAHEIWLGVNSVDYSGYPDCRPAYITAYQNLANVATKIGLEQGIKIVTPLLNMSKEEIISLGIKNEVDYSMTRSCYQLDDYGVSCGRCESCILRKEAFSSLGLSDPIPYHD